MTEEINDVILNHPGLGYDVNKNTLEGEIYLPDGDSYEVLIDLNVYPSLFPTVYETEGRIPRKLDRHIYTETGSCCFTTRAQSQVLLKTKITSLLKFIDEILVKYLENNTYYELNGNYYGQEYSHNIEGIIEGYMDILKLENILKTIEVIKEVLLNKSLKIHQDCYCGSGRRLRKCKNGQHLKGIRQLWMVDKKILKEDLIILYSYLDVL